MSKNIKGKVTVNTGASSDIIEILCRPTKQEF